RVTSEGFTIIPHPLHGEISLLVAGLNIALDLEEARELTRQLLTGMQMLGRAERAPGAALRSPKRTAPIAGDMVAAQPSSSASGLAAGDTAEEPMVLSSEASVADTPAGGAKGGDRRGGKRLRGLLRVLGREEDTAAGLDQPCFGS